MASDVEVEDAPPVMADDEKAVENAKSDRWHREKVHRYDGLAVIPQEGQPALGRFGVSGCTLHPAGDGSLRYFEAQHQKFAMNPRCAPGRVLRHHLENQISDFLGEFPSRHLRSRFGDQAPVHAKTSTMPTDHGLRRDKNERLLPGGPEPASGDPKELVEETDFGFGMPALQHRELLPEGQILQEQVPAPAKTANN